MRFVKIACLMALLGMLGVAGWRHAKKALDAYFNRGSVVTPSVVGKSLEQAVQNNLLTVKIASHINSSDVPAGHVVAQEPAPGTPVHANTPIRIVLSRGSDMVSVPALGGQSLRKAKLMLSDARLGLGQVCTLSSDRPRDTILAQYPAASGQLGKGGLVDLLVSAGAPTTTRVMPRLIGLEEARARGLLEKLGIGKVDTLEKPGAEGTVIGAVEDQDPQAGLPLAADPRVILTVARAAAPDTPPSSVLKRLSFEFMMPPGLTHKRLDVYQTEDGQNRRVIHTGDHQPGEKVAIPIEGSGSIEIELYVDNIAFGTERF